MAMNLRQTTNNEIVWDLVESLSSSNSFPIMVLPECDTVGSDCDKHGKGKKKKLAYVCKHHRRDFQQPGNGREGDRNEAEAICFPTQPKTMKTSIIFLSELLFPLSCLAHVPLSNRKHFLHVFHQPISWHLWFFISEMFSEDFYAFVG